MDDEEVDVSLMFTFQNGIGESFDKFVALFVSYLIFYLLVLFTLSKIDKEGTKILDSKAQQHLVRTFLV